MKTTEKIKKEAEKKRWKKLHIVTSIPCMICAPLKNVNWNRLNYVFIDDENGFGVHCALVFVCIFIFYRTCIHTIFFAHLFKPIKPTANVHPIINLILFLVFVQFGLLLLLWCLLNGYYLYLHTHINNNNNNNNLIGFFLDRVFRLECAHIVFLFRKHYAVNRNNVQNAHFKRKW